MATPAADASGLLAALDAARAAGRAPDVSGAPEAELDAALRALVKRDGAAAGALLRQLAAEGQPKLVRKAARRALYRLDPAAAGVAPASGKPPTPIVRREAERVVQAWASSIDGTGARGLWLLVEGGLGGGLRLCSLLLSDTLGLVDAAGGPVTRKRLDAERAKLGGDDELRWVEIDPRHGVALVVETLAVHARTGAPLPERFAPWRTLFEGAAPAGSAAAAAGADPALLERSTELLAERDLGGWFADPSVIQEQAVSLLELRDSKLVVPDQVKAEREAAIVDAVIARAFDDESRRRLARRLDEVALVFAGSGRGPAADLARAVAAALRDAEIEATRVPLLRAMAQRGLEVAGDVTLGRVRLEDVTRTPARPPAA